MKNILIVCMVGFLMMACDRNTDIPQAPEPNVEAGQCVMSKQYTNCKLGVSPSTIQGLIQTLKDQLTRGVTGKKYTVYGSGSKTYEADCTDYDYINLPTAVTYWVNYDCNGISVDTKVYGPYASYDLNTKKAQHTSELNAEGYQIAYVEYQSVGTGSNLSYIVFYAYKPNSKNARQAAAVDALRVASMTNAMIGKPNRPLTDTLSQARRAYPELNQSQNVRDAYDWLKTVRSIVK